MAGNLNSFLFFFFWKNKTNKYPCAPSSLLSINRSSVDRSTPRIEGWAKPPWKQTISPQPFQQEWLRATDQMGRKNVGKLGKNVGKSGRNFGKSGGKNVSVSVRPPRDNVRGLFLQRNFAFSSGMLWRLQLSGVGGKKPQEVARSLWWCNCHIAPGLALLILARANHRANWAATTRSSSAFTSTAHPNEVWLKCNTLYQHTGWL